MITKSPQFPKITLSSNHALKPGDQVTFENVRFMPGIKGKTFTVSTVRKISEKAGPVLLARKINFGKNGNFVRYQELQTISLSELWGIVFRVLKQKLFGPRFIDIE